MNDTIEWLLNSDEPWTRYRTLIDLVDLPVNSPEVAAELEMSVGAVYMAKSRVLARIKQTIDEVERDDLDMPETMTLAK